MNTEFSYPKWADLPDLELYLDQVLLYVNQVCSSAMPQIDKGLTASMVNNYVKHGYVDKPVKKKYQRQQLARLIAITTLKTVFSIQEIADTLDILGKDSDSPKLYDDFVRYMNGETTEVTSIIASACQTVQLYQATLAIIHQEVHHER